MKKLLFLCGLLAMFAIMCASATESKCGWGNDVGYSLVEYNIVTDFSSANVVDFQFIVPAAHEYVMQNVQYVKADINAASPLEIPAEKWNTYENDYAEYNTSTSRGWQYMKHSPPDLLENENLNNYKSRRNF